MAKRISKILLYLIVILGDHHADPLLMDDLHIT